MLIISDSNIFIDMESGELLQILFRLPETFAVPNILYYEELAEHHANLPSNGLQILELREEFMLEAYQLRGRYTKLSQNDLFAMALAKQEICPLLTGDKNLRKAAKDEKIEVRGTLWLVERMFEEKIIGVSKVEYAYEGMRQEQRRLPWDEVDAQMKRLRKTEKK